MWLLANDRVRLGSEKNSRHKMHARNRLIQVRISVYGYHRVVVGDLVYLSGWFMVD